MRKDLFSLQPTNQIQLALYTPTDGSRENVSVTVHNSLFLPYCLWRDVPISLPLEPLAPFPLPSHLIIEQKVDVFTHKDRSTMEYHGNS